MLLVSCRLLSLLLSLSSPPPPLLLLSLLLLLLLLVIHRHPRRCRRCHHCCCRRRCRLSPALSTLRNPTSPSRIPSPSAARMSASRGKSMIRGGRTRIQYVRTERTSRDSTLAESRRRHEENPRVSHTREWKGEKIDTRTYACYVKRFLQTHGEYERRTNGYTTYERSVPRSAREVSRENHTVKDPPSNLTRH